MPEIGDGTSPHGGRHYALFFWSHREATALNLMQINTSVGRPISKIPHATRSQCHEQTRNLYTSKRNMLLGILLDDTGPRLRKFTSVISLILSTIQEPRSGT